MTEFLAEYDMCRQATIFYLVVDGVNLKVLTILDSIALGDERISLRVNWLGERATMLQESKPTGGWRRCKTEPEIIKMLQELQILTDWEAKIQAAREEFLNVK